MGSIFHSPKPPPPPPPPPKLEDPEARRAADIAARNRRGLQGTIATSARGVLDTAWPQRKSLLGE